MKARSYRYARGSISVEFALVSLLWIGLVTAIFEYGRYFLVAMQLQDVAPVATRELAALPLPATATFDEVIADAGVRAAFFDPRDLVVDITGLDASEIAEAVAELAPVNRLLAPLMVVEERVVSEEDRSVVQTLLRYPGALVQDDDPDSPTGLSVLIPVMVADSQGQEVLRWAAVLEEERVADDASAGHFALDAASPWAAMVGLRLNYPFHSAVWAAREACGGGSGICAPDEELGSLRLADDATVAVPPLPSGYALLDTTPRHVQGTSQQVFGGALGLGSLKVLGSELRPFRRLLTASAWARREVFAAP